MREGLPIILQRVVPHYRKKVFEELFNRYGWRVACAKDPPQQTDLNLIDDEPWIVPIEMRFPDPVKHYRASIDVERLLKEFNPRGVIAEFSLNANWVYSLSCKRLLSNDWKLIYWSHGFNTDRGFRNPIDFAYQYSRLPLYSAADAVICYSEAGAAWVKKWMPWKKVHVVRNTIDVLSLPKREQTKVPSSRDFRILSVGRMTPTKQYPMLIRVFQKLLHFVPHAHLTIIGDGPDRAVVEGLAGSEIGKRINIIGALYDEAKLADQFLMADLFVYTGGIGLAVNHALGYGVPVVIFEEQASGPFHSPESTYVKDGVTGWRVSPMTESAMVDCLRSLSMNEIPPKRALKKSIENFVHENIIMERMLEDFHQVKLANHL